MIIMSILGVFWYLILGIVIASLAARFGNEDFFRVRSKFSRSINPMPIIILVLWPCAIVAGVFVALAVGAITAIEKLSGTGE